MTKNPSQPSPSALSGLLSSHNAKSEVTALPLEVLHNLQYQHSWRQLQLYVLTSDKPSPELMDIDFSDKLLPSHSPRSALSESIYLISGIPPRDGYLHPDFQARLIRQKIPEKAIKIQREWVLPLSLGEKWTLKRLCRVFDALPTRPPLETEHDGDGDASEWTDAKRVLMGMLSTNGMGGDGTIVYYIIQEGEVKPRQNG